MLWNEALHNLEDTKLFAFSPYGSLKERGGIVALKMILTTQEMDISILCSAAVFKGQATISEKAINFSSSQHV